jgi:hypothetical protein
MASGEQPLLEDIHRQALGRAIEYFKIENLIETGTGPSSSGMEAARLFGLKGYSCDVYAPCVQRASQLYPEFRIEHSNSIDFLKAVLPELHGSTFFWLDGHCPTDQSCLPGDIFPLYDEMILVRDLKKWYEKDVIWIDDLPMIMDPANPVAAKVWDGVYRGDQGERWQGERSHSWQEFLDVFDKTHRREIIDSVLRLTPKC